MSYWARGQRFGDNRDTNMRQNFSQLFTARWPEISDNQLRVFMQLVGDQTYVQDTSNYKLVAVSTTLAWTTI